MLISGRELKLFLDEAWPGDDWYWDHDLFDDDPTPDVKYDTMEIGGIHYQGSAEDPTDGEGYDLAKLIRKWRHDKTYETFLIDLPKDRLPELKAKLKELKLSVKKL